MNSFIITTKDGKLIVMDGGFAQDATHMLARLQAISGQEIPHVDAWFLSHPHLDHISCILEIAQNHPDALQIDHVYYNFSSPEFIQRDEKQYYDNTPERFYAMVGQMWDKYGLKIVSAGDTVDVGDAHFEVLCSPDPEFCHNACNNASVVLKMTLASGSKSVLFLGDAGVEEGNKMLRMYAGTDRLKADYVQMAHHGQNGVERDVYEAVAPTGCLWCTPKWLWDNDAGKGYNTHVFKTIVVRGWMDELGVKEHYVMMNGEQVVQL